MLFNCFFLISIFVTMISLSISAALSRAFSGPFVYPSCLRFLFIARSSLLSGSPLPRSLLPAFSLSRSPLSGFLVFSLPKGTPIVGTRLRGAQSNICVLTDSEELVQGDRFRTLTGVVMAIPNSDVLSVTRWPHAGLSQIQV